MKSFLQRLFGQEEPAGDRCSEMAAAFERRLQMWRRVRRTSDFSGKVGVVISPWVETAVPYYSLEWALRLDQAGFAVEALWDPEDVIGSAHPRVEEEAIRRTLALLPSRIAVRSLPPKSGLRYNGDRQLLEQVLFENETRHMGREPAEWCVPGSEIFFDHAQRVMETVQSSGFDWLFVPGGVWGVTSLYWNACEKLGIDLTTYDSGEGQICLHHGGPAAHFPDVVPAIRRLADIAGSDPGVIEEIERWTSQRMKVREAGDDEFQLQPKGAAIAAGFDVVVPLNYRIDTAAMCRQRLFPSVNHWIRALVEWVQAHPSVRMVFRQHPCEKIEAYRSNEDYHWINELRNPRLRFVAADEPVNTYQLIRDCRVVAPYSSRVGLEGALLGKPVVLAAKCYYDSLEFAQGPATTEEYFSCLARCCEHAGSQPPDLQRLALIAYYVVERFTLLNTSFTPIFEDFSRWVLQPPAELWADSTVDMLFRSASRREPLSMLLLERDIKEGCIAS